MINIFFSYCHADESLRDQLEKHLSGLRNRGIIDNWHDRRIAAGDVFSQEISHHLEEADIILFLVSADFMASNYCWNIEMKRAMERHEEQSATVIPVIIRACDWMDSEFAKLMAAPSDGKPITKWADRDEAFLDVVKSIKRVIEKKSQQTPATHSDPVTALKGSTTTPLQTQEEQPRSSNLSLKKEFSDRDRSEFLHDTFEYMVSYIRNSLDELSARNETIDGTIRRIDNNSFTVCIFNQGKEVASCRIFLGSHGQKSICYGNDANGSGNSFNESLAVEHDDQALYMRATMASFGFDFWNTKKLTQEGASEYFWMRLIEPLQR